MTTSYKFVDATILVTMRYLTIPLVTICGYYIWDEILTIKQVIGGILIIFACVIITIREIKDKNFNYKPPFFLDQSDGLFKKSSTVSIPLNQIYPVFLHNLIYSTSC